MVQMDQSRLTCILAPAHDMEALLKFASLNDFIMTSPAIQGCKEMGRLKAQMQDDLSCEKRFYDQASALDWNQFNELVELGKEPAL